MNILYDHQTFSLQQHGGISRYFYELIPRISRKADVSVFMGVHVNEYSLEESRGQFQFFMGLRVPFVAHTLTARLKLNALLLNRFANRINDGIYHQTYFYDVLRRWKGKRVVTVYDMIYELFPNDYDHDDPTARNKAESVRRADFVICISEQTRNDVIRLLRVSKEKTAVVYLANSMTQNPTSSRLVAAPYFLYVGKRGGYKNFRTLAEAFVRFSLRKEFQLVCFGGGTFTREELEMLASLSIIDKCKHVEGSDDDLANLYKYASAFVFPSKYEGFGIPPLEAMHYGCPVVASNASSIPEVVGDAGLFFNPSSSDELAESLEKVVSDSALRSSIIERGRAREQQFSWDRCAQVTFDIYQRLS